jgi:hypothetical protein
MNIVPCFCRGFLFYNGAKAVKESPKENMVLTGNIEQLKEHAY